MTLDGLPIVGRAPGWDNVYLSTGGGTKGILFSTGMAKAIAELITTGASSLPIAALSPERFASVGHRR
jgi:D-amino-acid dehydrogenase